MPRPKGSHQKEVRRDARQRAWQSMRIAGRFTLPQIETATPEIKENNLTKFTRLLARAGYLRCVREHVSGRAGSFKIWQIVRNSGPKRPIPWTDGRVYDPNTGKIYGANGEETSE